MKSKDRSGGIFEEVVLQKALVATDPQYVWLKLIILGLQYLRFVHLSLLAVATIK